MNKAQKEMLKRLAGPERECRLQELWPALKGSLAKVYKPCIRKSCPACERGDKHPAWILTVSIKGRRKCLYVPESLVPVIQHAIENGREIEERLSNMGPLMIQAFRKQRDSAPKKNTRASKS
jgi:hypothetical protein